MTDIPENLYRAGSSHDKPLLIINNANEAGLFAAALKQPIDTNLRFREIVDAEFGDATDLFSSSIRSIRKRIRKMPGAITHGHVVRPAWPPTR